MTVKVRGCPQIPRQGIPRLGSPLVDWDGKLDEMEEPFKVALGHVMSTEGDVSCKQCILSWLKPLIPSC